MASEKDNRLPTAMFSDITIAMSLNVAEMCVVGIAVFLLAGLAEAAPASGPDANGTDALLRDGFEEGLSSWKQSGQADFALDANETRGGRQSARITVPAGAEANAPAPMLWRMLPGVAPGDWLKAAAYVRTRDVADGIGAYIMVEFLDANGKRTDFFHPSYSRDRGKAGWQLTEIDAIVPKGVAAARLALVMQSHGSAWFDDVEVALTQKHVDFPVLGDAAREVVIHADQIVNPKFGGVGFHCSDHGHPASRQQLDEVIEKRWRELNPSFTRLNHHNTWDRAMLARVADRLTRMKTTGTELYVATWDPKVTSTPQETAAYARMVVDDLEFLVRAKGLTNIKTYCMTNELTLTEWGSMWKDLPRFKNYHQAFYDELKARKLDIGLLATDASPIGRWETIEWASKNMDDITAVYGGHHYIEEYAPGDEQFYPWFLSKMEWGAAQARKHGKGFIMGEFGGRPGTHTVGRKRFDTCYWWDKPEEPMLGLQLAEATVAAINGGLYATGYWTFADYPDRFDSVGGTSSGDTYANKWGLFHRTDDGNFSTRAPYYAYGLLTKFFRGPATACKVTGNDPLLRVAAVQHHGAKTWSIAAINRNDRPVSLSFAIEEKLGTDPTFRGEKWGLSLVFRKYVYDPSNVPQNPFGDLQPPAGKVAVKDGKLSDTLAPRTLAVYTTAYDDEPPAAVRGLKAGEAPGGKRALSWQASEEKDICYYRVFRSDKADFVPDVKSQIGSTIATTFADAKAETGKQYHYEVQAVDTSGNAGPP